ncbi:MAG: YdjY domain-containing protein [Planctomycetota bacterium]
MRWIFKAVFPVALVGILSCQSAPANRPVAAPEVTETPKVPAVRVIKEGKVFLDERRIEIRAEFEVVKGLIEYLITNENGPVHETLFVMLGDPEELAKGLRDIGVADGAASKTDPGRVRIRAVWEADGGRVEVPIEECVRSVSAKGVMPLAEWVFTGSRYWENPETKEKFFLAKTAGVVAALFRDPDAMLNNSLRLSDGFSKEGGHIEGNPDEYLVNTDRVPASGTPVTLIFTPAGRGAAK